MHNIRLTVNFLTNPVAYLPWLLCAINMQPATITFFHHCIAFICGLTYGPCCLALRCRHCLALISNLSPPPNLPFLLPTDNPLHCDCKVDWLLRWLSQHPALTREERESVVCATPPALENAPLVSHRVKWSGGGGGNG